MNQHPHGGPNAKTEYVGKGQLNASICISVAAIFSAVSAAVGQSLPDSIHKTIAFCFAAFCGLQVPLLLLYYRVLRPNSVAIPTATIPTVAGALPVTVLPGGSEGHIPIRLTNDIFEVEVGGIWEKQAGYDKFRLELTETHVGNAPKDLGEHAMWLQAESAIPFAEVRVNSGHKVLMGTSAVILNSAGDAPVLYLPPPGDADPLLKTLVDFVIQNP